MCWKWDGSSICILDRNSQLTVVDGRRFVKNEKNSHFGVETVAKKTTSCSLNRVVWTADDRLIVAATADGTVCCFDGRTLSKVHEFAVHNGSCFSMSLSGDCRWMATGGADSMVNVFDLNHLIQEYAFTAGDSAVNEVAFNWNSKLIASCSDDHSIKV